MAHVKSPLSSLWTREAVQTGAFQGKERLRVSHKSRETLARVVEETEMFRQTEVTPVL